MQNLIFIHGAESFLDVASYISFLQNEYIPRYTKPWEDCEKVDYRKEIAKKWKEQGGQVWYPAMPNKQNARYRDWKMVFEGILAQLNSNDEITLVGASLGGCFLLKYFSEQNREDNPFVISIRHGGEKSLSKLSYEKPLSIPTKVKEKGIPTVGQKGIHIHQIHLVATCISEGDFTAPKNYDFLRNFGNRVHIWHAEDDRVVPFTIGQELSLIMSNAIFHPFAPDRGYGHFHGIPTFPELGNELLKT